MRRIFPSAEHGSVVLIVAAAAAVVAPAARAVEPFVIKDIRVEGLQRTDPGTVFAALPFRIGDTYTDDKGAAALRALFATGLFKDVRIEIEGTVAVVIVDERAIIASVSFVGLREFDKDPLTKSLKDAGIGEGLPFDRALIDRAEQEIKRQYLTRSLYGAEVTTTVTPIERNRVNVTFTMNEGDAAKIKSITIAGNSVFSDSTLLDQFELSESGWFTWYSKTDRYSRSKLNADLERLRAFYLNRGYLEFAVESTQVTISPDKQDISIAISVREGQPYTVTAVRLEGDYLGKEDEFRALVSFRPGEPYRGDSVTETAKRFTERFGLYGYAFARVEQRPEIDRASGQVTVVLAALPERRVYVRRIDVAGNTRTRDEVVRREFRQLEASWYDGSLIKLSKERPARAGAAGAAVLLHRHRHRDQRGAGHARPGGPGGQPEGEADRQPDRGRRLQQRRALHLHRRHPPGQRLRQRQLAGAGDQQQQDQPRARHQHLRSVLDGGRHLAQLRPCLPQGPRAEPTA